MPLVEYVFRDFSDRTLRTIDQANEIIEEYAAQDFDLTLRQLYYQFVARGLLANKQSEYKRLGSIVNDARLAGLIDWEQITDRTRNLEDLPHWASPAEILRGAAQQFRVDRWAEQPVRVEVWIEKEALAGVFQRICEELDVPYFSCRGYVSQSEMWAAAQRIIGYTEAGQEAVILHFGDHDPSGIDMTRDIRDRLEVFGAEVEVRRLALTWEQIQEYDPPPNPAKDTDSRHGGYVQLYGTESWELDALEPSILSALVRSAVEREMDVDAWTRSFRLERTARDQLEQTGERWADVVNFLETRN